MPMRSAVEAMLGRPFSAVSDFVGMASPSPRSNPSRVSLKCKSPPPMAGWFRFAPQAPATESRPGCTGEIITMMRLQKIGGSLRCLQTPTGWTSPPTHFRKNIKYSRPDRSGGEGFLPCVREAAPPALHLASSVALPRCGFGGDGCASCWWSPARRRCSSEVSPMPSVRGWFGGGLSRLEGRATPAPAHPAPLAQGIAIALPSLPSPPQGWRCRAAKARRHNAAKTSPIAGQGIRGFGRGGRNWERRRARIWAERESRNQPEVLV